MFLIPSCSTGSSALPPNGEKMEKKYVIKITDTHKQEEQTFSSELTALGDFEVGDDGFVIHYIESDPSMEGSETTVHFHGGSLVEITRRGAFGTQLILEKGRRNTCLYSTPYGDISVGVFTKFINNSLTAEGGVASFGYTLNFGSGEETENTLSYSIREAQ